MTGLDAPKCKYFAQFVPNCVLLHPSQIESPLTCTCIILQELLFTFHHKSGSGRESICVSSIRNPLLLLEFIKGILVFFFVMILSIFVMVGQISGHFVFILATSPIF